MQFCPIGRNVRRAIFHEDQAGPALWVAKYLGSCPAAHGGLGDLYSDPPGVAAANSVYQKTPEDRHVC